MSEEDEIARLYKRLARLDDAVVLQRMQAHGYWPAQTGFPPDPSDEANERREIEAELARIGKSAVTQDVEPALKAERIRRWDESKKRRSIKKAERDAQRRAQLQAWAQIKAATIVHAGIGVSAQLGDTHSDVDKLTAQGLPILHSAADLAAALGISMSRLRWLSFHRRGATLVHYHRYGIAKKSGGIRAISAPKPVLDQCQRWILAHILTPLPVTQYAHGFVSARSCVSNAAQHIGRKVLINMDLKDFFPSIHFSRVRGLYRAFGYSGAVASLLALLCTEPPRIAASIAGDPRQRVFHVALGDRCLPQGACCSPAITNLICKGFDQRLAGLARKQGYTFTRYADDLSFSGDNRDAVGALLGAVRRVVANEGFAEHPDKTQIMGQARRQEVTGLVVNHAVGLKREDKRRLRAMLHNAAKFGLESQNRENHPNFAHYLQGWVAYAVMVDPSSAAVWKSALRRALKNA